MERTAAAVRKRAPQRVAVGADAERTGHFEMPEVRYPIRHLLPVPLLISIGVTLSACSGGDFYRTRADFRNDDMHKWVGREATVSVRNVFSSKTHTHTNNHTH